MIMNIVTIVENLLFLSTSIFARPRHCESHGARLPILIQFGIMDDFAWV
jgi:hypothetical protein